MSKIVLEIVKEIDAKKKADDIKSQKLLAEMGELVISDDQKKLLQDQAAAFASKFSIDAGAATAFESSSIQEMLKEVGKAAADQSHFQEMMKNFAEASQAAGVNEELKKLLANNLNGILTKPSDILPKENIIAPSYASLSFLPSPQERMADELAESNRVNKEILDEMRKQRLRSLPEQPKPQGKTLKEKVIEIHKLNLAFDVLDAATERCLTRRAPHGVFAERISLTAASVVYYLKHIEFGNLGKFTIIKTGDKKSEIEISDSPTPDDQEAVSYFYHQNGWRVVDGSYHVKLDSGNSRIMASDLVPLIDQLYQLRQEHLSKIVIPAYFESLQGEDIWSAEEQQNFQTLNPKSDNLEKEKLKSESIKVHSERTKALNQLALLWVEYNQTQRISKDDDMGWFVGENAKAVGLNYLSVTEFKKHLPKAYKAKIIDKDKKTGRFIPKLGT